MFSFNPVVMEKIDPNDDPNIFFCFLDCFSLSQSVAFAYFFLYDDCSSTPVLNSFHSWTYMGQPMFL